VKWKVLPLPSALSTHIVPPIAAASLEEITNPRPVPPYNLFIRPPQKHTKSFISLLSLSTIFFFGLGLKV
jgi:hypothetical protein